MGIVVVTPNRVVYSYLELLSDQNDSLRSITTLRSFDLKLIRVTTTIYLAICLTVYV